MENKENKIYKLHVHKMHCPSCVVLTETELCEHPDVFSAKSDLKTKTVEICGDFGTRELAEIAEELSQRLSQHHLSTDAERVSANWQEFFLAVPIAIAFIAGFVLLQKLGVINLIGGGGELNYGTAFIIGLVASISTCMAVVGGLLLSMSATFAQGGKTFGPQILFHIGRLLAFFFLGGVIGALGAVFSLGASGTFILGLLIGIIMLILGINLLEVFPWAKRLQIRMPKFLSKHVMHMSKLNNSLTPFLVGIATFFLPCGFTQSMQIYTLSTGSFLAGGLTMIVFALGTLPVLALISFSSINIQGSARAGVFFKTAGLIVIAFGLINIVNSLVVIGLIPPLFNF